MEERIIKELELLKKEYPNLEFKEDVNWIRIPFYKLPIDLWNQDVVCICFQIPLGYPGNPPYAFFVENGLRVKGTDIRPESYEEPAHTPFDGLWAKFSWQQDNSWKPISDLKIGSNLLNFVRSFHERFKQGK